MIPLAEERRTQNIVYLDFSKAFSTVPLQYPHGKTDIKYELESKHWGGLKVDWTVNLKDLQSATWSPAGSQWHTPGADIGATTLLTSSLKTYMIGQRTSSASLQLIQNWEEHVDTAYGWINFHLKGPQ